MAEPKTAASTEAAIATGAGQDRGGRRSAKTFPERRSALRYWAIVAVLVLAAAGFTYGLLAWGNPMPPGSRGFWLIAEMRMENVIVMAVVAVCQATATVSFQTVTNNRIITPSIMGFESIYVAVQTSVIFFFGSVGLASFDGTPAFLLQSGLMVLFAVALFGWLLSGKFGNIQVMLLVGIVLGGGLRSLSTFMQRLLDPNEFDILTARTFGNIGNADTDNFGIVIPVVLVVCVLLYLRSRRLNVVALGNDTANNLGVNHRRELMILLLLISVLMAMTTSLVGPMTFLGFLVATIAYQLTDTYDHRLIFPVAALIGYVFLTGSYFIMRNFFDAEGAVTIIIELIGGSVFLLFILRKGRL